MSVAYQSWEVAAGPTVGYKVGAQGNLCGTEGPNYRRHPQQDTVIRGLSALSIYVQSQSEADASVGQSRGQGDSSSLSKEQSSPSIHASHPTGCRMLPDQQFAATPEPQLYKADRFTNGLASTSNVDYSLDNGRLLRFHGIPDVFSNQYQPLSTLDVVSEDRPWVNCPTAEDSLEQDTISSCSSISDAIEDSPCSSGDVSQGVSGDTEAQSSYKGPLDCLSSLEASLPIKKGLSRFFSGKSRSFSCLADVGSVKELAKPENPYNRKRKIFSASTSNLDRPRLHPLRNGAAGISKKPLHNSKCTLALAVAMSTKEGPPDADEQECQASLGASGRMQSSSAPSRSFSLSDLQGAASYCSPQITQQVYL